MEERLRTDLFCSLLMANRIMTGKQILKLSTEEKMKSLSEFWERREELIVEERMTSDQKEKWIHFKESPAYLRIDEYVDYVNKRQIRSMNRLDDEYPEYMTHLTNMPLILFYRGDRSLLDKGKTRVCIVGTRRPESTPMIAITTMSSMRVKPLIFLLLVLVIKITSYKNFPKNLFS